MRLYHAFVYCLYTIFCILIFPPTFVEVTVTINLKTFVYNILIVRF